MSDGPGFDPRYNPEFQRGYEAPARNAPQDLDRAPRPAAGRQRTAAQRVASIPVVAAPEQEISKSEALEPSDALDDLFAEDVHDGPGEAPPWRNPYLISLTAIGIVMTIAGVSLFRWAVTQMYSGPMSNGFSPSDDQSGWIWVQVASGIAPMLAIAGTLTIIGVIFVLAVRWTPRQHDIDDADDVLDG